MIKSVTKKASSIGCGSYASSIGCGSYFFDDLMIDIKA